MLAELHPSHVQTRLDDIAVRAAMRESWRTELSSKRIVSRFVRDVVSHFVLEAKNGVMHEMSRSGKGSEAYLTAEPIIAEKVTPAVESVTRELCRRPAAKRMSISRKMGKSLGMHTNLLGDG